MALSTLNNNYSHTENTESTENACCTRVASGMVTFSTTDGTDCTDWQVASPLLVGIAECSLNPQPSTINSLSSHRKHGNHRACLLHSHGPPGGYIMPTKNTDNFSHADFKPQINFVEPPEECFIKHK